MTAIRRAQLLLRPLLASAMILGAAGCGGGDEDAAPAAKPKAFSTVYVMDGGLDAVKGWDSALTVTGDVAPIRSIAGANTGISGAHGIAYDSRSGSVLVGDNASDSIRVFAGVRTVNGDVAPARVIAGASTQLDGGYDLALDEGRDLLYATTYLGVLVFTNARTADGDVAPARVITGANVPIGGYDHRLALDAQNDRLFIAEFDNSAVLVYDAVSTKDGDVAPDRQVTLGASPWGIALDASRDILYVNLYSGATILAFGGASTVDGAATPDRTLTGASIVMSEGCDMALDAVSDMLYATTGSAVLVWHEASTKTGDVAPDRTIVGASTGFSRPVDIVGAW